MKLWHDDVRPAPKGWIWARTNEQAIAALENGWPFDEISLDHDLGFHDVEIPDDPDEFIEVMQLRGRAEETGADLVRWMIANKYVPPKITIHSWNPDGAKEMANLLMDAGHSPYVAPFKPQEAAWET